MSKITMRERTAQMRAFALQLRKDGHSFAAIGRMLGTQFASLKSGPGVGVEGAFSSQHAFNLVNAGLKDIYREDAKALIKLELERLDDMQLEALDVLRGEHCLVSSGAIIKVNVLDEAGRVVMNPLTGLPLAKPILDDGPRLAAIDRLLKIQERRARLLGLDKPTKVASTNPEGTKAVAPWTIVASPLDQKI